MLTFSIIYLECHSSQTLSVWPILLITCTPIDRRMSKKKKKGHKRTAEPASISTKLSVTLQASYFHTGLSSKCTRGPIEYHITKNWITKSVTTENPNNPTALARPNLSRIKQGYPPLALYQLLLSFNMSLFLKNISSFLLFFFFLFFIFQGQPKNDVTRFWWHKTWPDCGTNTLKHLVWTNTDPISLSQPWRGLKQKSTAQLGFLFFTIAL